MIKVQLAWQKETFYNLNININIITIMPGYDQHFYQIIVWNSTIKSLINLP